MNVSVCSPEADKWVKFAVTPSALLRAQFRWRALCR